MTTFRKLDNLQIKYSWALRLSVQERELTPFWQNLYNNVKRYSTKGHQNSKKSVKLKNYIVWVARGFPHLSPKSVAMLTSSGTKVMADMLCTEFTGHPYSDIVDAYTIARHLFFVDRYSG